MVKTICLNFSTQFCPILSTWDKDIFKEFFDAIRFWYKFSSRVLIKVSTIGIIRFFEVVEGNTTFARNVVWFYESPVVHEHEVDARKLNRLRWSVFDQLLGKVAMKSHGSKTKGMRQFISVVNSWNGYDMRAICNEGQSTNHGTNRTTKIRWSHHVNYVGWTKVTGDVCSHLNKFLGIVDQAWFLNLKDLWTQVTHDDFSINRVCPVSSINVDYIWIARFLLQFRNFSFQITCLNFSLADIWISNQLIVFFSDVDVVKWYSVFTFHRVWAEEVHFFILTRQLVELVWHDDPKWESLHPNFFISIFFLSWKEGDDVWVEDVEVNHPSPLALSQLVRVREAIFEEFHNWNHSRSGSFIPFDWCSSFTKVAERNPNPTTDTRQLKGRVDGTSDRIHIIGYLDQETWYQFPTAGTSSV